MRTALFTALVAVGCGGGTQKSADTSPKLLHSPELNEIMKAGVNQPFSALIFLVFHAPEANPNSTELEYAKIAMPASMLREGVFKVRSIVDPPVVTTEARAVFFTYVDAMVRDADQLTDAVTRRDRGRTEKLLTKISDTCNDCHRFFRLKDVEDAP